MSVYREACQEGVDLAPPIANGCFLPRNRMNRLIHPTYDSSVRRLQWRARTAARMEGRPRAGNLFHLSWSAVELPERRCKMLHLAFYGMYSPMAIRNL